MSRITFTASHSRLRPLQVSSRCASASRDRSWRVGWFCSPLPAQCRHRAALVVFPAQSCRNTERRHSRVRASSAPEGSATRLAALPMGMDPVRSDWGGLAPVWLRPSRATAPVPAASSRRRFLRPTRRPDCPQPAAATFPSSRWPTPARVRHSLRLLPVPVLERPRHFQLAAQGDPGEARARVEHRL